MQKFACVANLPLKSGKLVALLFSFVAVALALAVMFNSPNSKPFGYR
jgi:hypothetical protein